MKEEKKICFFLNWVREIDMFENIFKRLDKNEIFFIINDLNKSVAEHKKEHENISNFLKERKLEYDFLSKVQGKKRFKFLLSTGDLPVSKFDLISFIKYLYGKSFGSIIQLLGLNIYLKKIFNREFTAGGINAKIYNDIYIEKQISNISVKFPNGLDRNIKFFPNKKWLNVFDIYFSSSILENNLIKKKFKNKKTYYVGYSRFDGKSNSNLSIIKNEFNLDLSKKTIYCCPNERIMFEQSQQGIIEYLEYLKLLGEKFNVIMRPHPKLKFSNPHYFKLIENSGIKLDLRLNRKIEDLYLSSDLVIGDYGSSVLEAIYLKRRIMIYKWPKEENFKILFDKKNCLDQIVKDELMVKGTKTNLTNKEKIDFIFNIITSSEYQKKINNIKLELFGTPEIISDPYKILKNLYEK